MNHAEIGSFLWSVADLIRDTFKRGKYQDVILPLTLLQRLDCVLAPTKEKVLKTQASYKGKLENLDRLLRQAARFPFYNSSRGLSPTLLKDRDEFEEVLDDAAKRAVFEPSTPARKAILSALSERDEAAVIRSYKDGKPESAPELRETENVPLPEGEDPVNNDGVPRSVRELFRREMKPHVLDAWIDTSRRDPKDGKVAIVGYEICFNGYFYRYTPPRPLEEIEADIRGIEKDIVRMLAEMARRAE